MPRFAQNPQSPATVLGGEAAIVTPSDSRMHVLNRVATRIWELCDGDGMEMDALVGQLSDEFDAERETIVAETEAFLSEALRLGLVVQR
ncbi:MAG: PqqD family protein [Myxococcales bacterium]|nr:PqqD family protein [Myxococcales bacterium]MCB9530230.1 PqqD family protein [Myxococcales bacterium]MCB9533743.1 PqqD family protein [Myxococcales bacterium]